MTREGKHARELKDHYSFCIRDKNPSLVVMQGCPKALNQTCHQRHGITQQEQESCCAALPCPPGAPWTCSGRRALQPAGNAMFSDVILLGLSYGMLSSCQHCSLAHSALSSPHLCFPPESWGSSQVLPCQALLTTQAPAPLELFPAPVPAHSHVFFFSPSSWLQPRACQLLSEGG